MGTFDHFIVDTSKPIDRDEMRANFKKGQFNGHFNCYRFIDKDTRQAIAYVPSIDISGYGENYNRAIEMLKFNLDQYFEHLSSLSLKDAEIELSTMGWNRKFFNKRFSKVANLNIEEDLTIMNADKSTIERITLKAA